MVNPLAEMEDLLGPPAPPEPQYQDPVTTMWQRTGMFQPAAMQPVSGNPLDQLEALQKESTTPETLDRDMWGFLSTEIPKGTSKEELQKQWSQAFPQVDINQLPVDNLYRAYKSGQKLIDPISVGWAEPKDENVAAAYKLAKQLTTPIQSGVNRGSYGLRQWFGADTEEQVGELAKFYYGSTEGQRDDFLNILGLTSQSLMVPDPSGKTGRVYMDSFRRSKENILRAVADFMPGVDPDQNGFRNFASQAVEIIRQGASPRPKTFFAKGWHDFVQMSPMIVETIALSGRTGGISGGAEGSMAGMSGRAAAASAGSFGRGGVLGTAAAAARGAAPGLLPTAYWTGQTYPDLHRDLVTSGVDETQAKPIALVGSVIIGAIEQFQPRFGITPTKMHALEGSIRQRLREVGKERLYDLAREWGEEPTQGVVEKLTKATAQYFSQPKFETESMFDWDAEADDLAQQIVDPIVPLALMIGPGSIGVAGREVLEEHKQWQGEEWRKSLEQFEQQQYEPETPSPERQQQVQQMETEAQDRADKEGALLYLLGTAENPNAGREFVKNRARDSRGRPRPNPTATELKTYGLPAYTGNKEARSRLSRQTEEASQWPAEVQEDIRQRQQGGAAQMQEWQRVEEGQQVPEGAESITTPWGDYIQRASAAQPPTTAVQPPTLETTTPEVETIPPEPETPQVPEETAPQPTETAAEASAAVEAPEVAPEPETRPEAPEAAPAAAPEPKKPTRAEEIREQMLGRPAPKAEKPKRPPEVKPKKKRPPMAKTPAKAKEWLADAVRRAPSALVEPTEIAAWIHRGFSVEDYKSYLDEREISLEDAVREAMPQAAPREAEEEVRVEQAAPVSEGTQPALEKPTTREQRQKVAPMMSRNAKYGVATLLATNTLEPTVKRLQALGLTEAVEFARQIDKHYRKRDGFVPKKVIAIVNQARHNAETPKPKEKSDSEQKQRTMDSDRSPLSELGAAGSEAGLVTAEGKTRKIQYVAVEANEIIPSHDARKAFTRNEGGDENERPYHDPKQGAASRQTVIDISKASDQEKLQLLVSDTRSPTDGPPITTDTGVVLGGNARAMGIQLAYHNGGNAAARIKSATVEAAGKFGIDAATVEAMEQPVIVRVIDVPGERGELSALLNESLAASRSQATVAVSQGKRVSVHTATVISAMLEPEGLENAPTLRDVLGKPKQAERIIQMLRDDGAWSDREIALYVDPKTTGLNADGKSAIEQLLVGRLISDPSIVGDASPSVRNKLVSALGPLVRGMSDATHGQRITQVIKDAVQAYAGYKAESLPLERYFMKQQALFDVPGQGDYAVAGVVHALDKMGPRKFKNAMDGIVRSLGIKGAKASKSLFGELEQTVDTVEDAVKEEINPPLKAPTGTSAKEKAEAAAKKAEDIKVQMTRRSKGKPTMGLDPELVKLAGQYIAYKIEEGVYRLKDIVDSFVEGLSASDAKWYTQHLEAAWKERPAAEKPPKPPKRDAQGVKPVSTPDATSVKNRIVDDLRERRGLPPMEASTPETFQEWLDSAERLMTIDPELPHKLIAELTDLPRTLSDIETAVMQRHYRWLNNLLDGRQKALDKAQEGGDPSDIAEALGDVEAVLNDLIESEKATKPAGTAAGRSLVARKMELAQDYSLARLTMRARVAKGEELTAEDNAKIKELSDRIAELEKQLNDLEKSKGDKEVDSKLDDEIEKARKRKPTKRTKPSKKEAKRKRVDEAWQKLNAALGGGLAMAGEPRKPGWKARAAEVIPAAIEVVRAYVDLGVTSFGELLTTARADGAKLDENTRDALEEAYNELYDKGEVKKPDIDYSDREELSRLAKDMMLGHISAGIVNREELVDAVHNELKRYVPDITRRNTKEAMAGYGIYRELNKDELKVKQRDLSGQIRELLKIEDMGYRVTEDGELEKVKEGTAPERTGVEFPEPTDDQRRLIKLVNEAKKRGGYLITDPDRQLQTALTAAKTAVRNSISDMEQELRTGKRIVKTITPLRADEELERLRRHRDELRQLHSMAFPKTLSLEQQIDRTSKALDRSIAQLEEQLANFDIMPSQKKEPLRTPLLDAKRERLNELRAARDELRANSPEYQAAVEERQNAAYKRSLHRRLADIKRRIAEEDFAPREKKERELDQDTLDLLFEIENHKRTFRAMEDHWKRSQLEGLAKARDMFEEGLRVQRAVHTAIDWSGMGRQAWMTTTGRPLFTLSKIPETWRATRSKKEAFRIMQEILRRPNALLYAQTKLALTDIDGPLSRQEEVYMSRFSQKIPLVAASERAYVTFLNLVRADLFDTMIADLRRSGNFTMERAKVIARAVGDATGRATIPTKEQHIVTAGTYFYAPRYVLSRFRMLVGAPMWGGDAVTRKMIAKWYVRSIAGIAAFYTLVHLWSLGYDDDDEDKPQVSSNVFGSDLGKVKVGNLRLDPLGGYSQCIVFLAQQIGGKKANQAGATMPIRGENRPYNAPKQAELFGRFVRSKLAPVFSATADLLTQEDLIGRKVTAKDVIIKNMIPLSVQDVYETAKAENIPTTLVTAFAVFLGMNAQEYAQGEVGELYAEKTKLEWDKKQQGEKFDSDIELAKKRRMTQFLSNLRKLSKMQKDPDAAQTGFYAVGAARAALGREEKPRYPNPFKDGIKLPPAIQKEVDKHLETQAYAVAKIDKENEVKPESLESMRGAQAYLKSLDVPNDKLVELLVKRLAREAAADGRQLKSDTAYDWVNRLLERVGR